MAVVKIASDLERVGDLAVNIAEATLRDQYCIAEDVIFIVAARDVRHHATADSSRSAQ